MDHEELIQQVRGMLQRGVVGGVDDTGDVQTVDLNTGDDVGRSMVEVHQPYGHASRPPEAQPGTIVFSIGGDQGHQVALQLFSAYRFGKLRPGEVAVYDWGGNRLHLKAGGNVDLLAAALLQLLAQVVTVTAKGAMTLSAGTSMTLSATDGFTFTGPVEFQSAVTFDKPVAFKSNVTIGGTLTVGGTVTGTGASGRSL